MAISIGIAKKDREQIGEQLSKLLADTYSLYLKTHSFHWNITGPQFNSLHTMFETQYNELWLAADEVAERIRTLDVFAPGSYSQFGKLTADAVATRDVELNFAVDDQYRGVNDEQVARHRSEDVREGLVGDERQHLLLVGPFERAVGVHQRVPRRVLLLPRARRTRRSGT